jgi:class 3 adenylate cyclase
MSGNRKAQEDVIELGVQKTGRWSVAERFRAHEKDEAIARARFLVTQAGIEAVRVTREVFDEADGLFKTRTIFRQLRKKDQAQPEKAPPPPPKRPVARQAAMTRTEAAAAAPPPTPAPPPPAPAEPRRGGRGRQIAAAAVTSTVMVGGGFFAVQSESMPTFIRELVTSPELLGAGAVAMFVAAFVASMYLFSRSPEARRVDRTTVTEASIQQVATAIANPGLVADPRVVALGDAIRAPDPEKPPDPAPEPAAQSEPEPVPVAAAEPEPPAAPEPTPPAAVEIAGASAEDRDALLKFLRDCLVDPAARAVLKPEKMDSQTRFACSLFLLGAGEALFRVGKSDPGGLGSVLQSALELVGVDPGRARSLVGNIDDYLREPRYRAVIRAGSLAMTAFMTGRDFKSHALADALTGFEAKLTEVQSSNVAIMFTDMVSSVQTTQALGDQGAMTLVHAHNAIVGAVLKTHRGKQVKHTGDGMMAVFPRVADGVAAAAEMQRQIASYNASTGGHPLSIRIGLSAGEPIREDNDYFGTVVQLSARVCSVAGSAEIAVTELVAESVAGQPFLFSEPREAQLKGFQGGQIVRMLLWRESGARDGAAVADDGDPFAVALAPVGAGRPGMGVAGRAG